MSFSKTLISGPAGSVSFSESAGNVSITVSGNIELGGGEAKGIAKAYLSGGVSVGAKQMADLSIEFLEAKYPAAKGLLEGIKTIMDKEMDAN